MDFRTYLDLIEDASNNFEPKEFDNIELVLGDTLLETYIEEVLEDGVVIKVDETFMQHLVSYKKQLNEKMKMGASTDASAGGTFVMGEGVSAVDELLQDLVAGRLDIINVLQNPQTEEEQFLKNKLQEKMKRLATEKNLDTMRDFKKLAQMVIQDIKKEYDSTDISEAEYQGRKVQLNKPMQGDVAKSKVYVKNAKGKVVKVNFGDKNMRIKKSNPNRRRNFRARHRCENPGPKWKARYWSCRAW